MPTSLTTTLITKAIAERSQSMSPHPRCKSILLPDHPLSLPEIAADLPELNQFAFLDDPWPYLEFPKHRLLTMEWAGLPGGNSLVSIDAIELPSTGVAIFQFGSLDLTRQLEEPAESIIAIFPGEWGGFPTDSFLEELIGSNGASFRLALMATAPNCLQCAYSGDRAVLESRFVECLEAAAEWGTGPLESLEQVVALQTDGDDETYSLPLSVRAYLRETLGPPPR